VACAIFRVQDFDAVATGLAVIDLEEVPSEYSMLTHVSLQQGKLSAGACFFFKLTLFYLPYQDDKSQAHASINIVAEDAAVNEVKVPLDQNRQMNKLESERTLDIPVP
jgi:hypothetical protein